MKKIVSVILAATLVLSGCDRTLTSPEGKEYKNYGIMNFDTHKSSKVCYNVDVENVIIALFFSPSIVIPGYIIGWSLFQPSRMKTGPEDKCSEVD